MKTLENFYQELIDDVFRSFSDEHRAHLNKMFRGKTAEWLTQKHQEQNDLWHATNSPVLKESHFWKKDFIDELLEETK